MSFRQAILVLLISLAGTGPALALRCDGRIVKEGDHALEVQHKCGAPTYTDSWNDSLLYGAGISAHLEDWYYNFGPSRLVQVLHFRNGRLSSIDSGGYGYAPSSDARCNPGDIGFGLSQFELLMRCGLPDSRERRFEFRSQRIGNDYSSPVSTRIDDWAYNFGPSQFIRHVTLVDGRVDRIEIGDRGY